MNDLPTKEEAAAEYTMNRDRHEGKESPSSRLLRAYAEGKIIENPEPVPEPEPVPNAIITVTMQKIDSFNPNTDDDYLGIILGRVEDLKDLRAIRQYGWTIEKFHGGWDE